MKKWADFGILRIRYGKDRSEIVEVEARPDQGKLFGAVERVTRAAVVDAIRWGSTFVTIHPRYGMLARGEQVRLVNVHDEKFLRTDDRAIRGDSLRALPEYD